MKFWILAKIIAGLAVLAVVLFTAGLCYHVAVKPLDGVFAKVLPDGGSMLDVRPEEDFAKALEVAEMPDFEPGDRAFQKAHELIVLGQIEAGRKKLMTIVNTFPNSPAAPAARRIVSEMNLDEVLDSSFSEGKTDYKVVSGDSYFAIAGRNDTTLDMLIHLNGMMELESLQPGDVLKIMALNFQVLIEPQRKSVSLWDEERFVCRFPIVRMDGISLKAGTSSIAARRSTIGSRNVTATSEDYRGSRKTMQLASPAVQILPYEAETEAAAPGIYLRAEDMEELFLLTRSGNTVEIRIRD